MDHSYVLHVIREAGRVKDTLGNGVSSNMASLMEGQVKISTTRHEQCACCQSRLRTNTVNRYIVLNIFERRSVHLLVCHSLCFDDDI
jgi:hypothetical protein